MPDPMPPEELSDAPHYVSNSGIARHLGVHHVTVIGWRKQFPPDHQQVPTPAPAAFVDEKSGYDLPLWSVSQLPEWTAWREVHAQYVAVNRRVRLAQVRPTRGSHV